MAGAAAGGISPGQHPRASSCAGLPGRGGVERGPVEPRRCGLEGEPGCVLRAKVPVSEFVAEIALVFNGQFEIVCTSVGHGQALAGISHSFSKK